jgi:hypothetical protein
LQNCRKYIDEKIRDLRKLMVEKKFENNLVEELKQDERKRF